MSTTTRPRRGKNGNRTSLLVSEVDTEALLPMLQDVVTAIYGEPSTNLEVDRQVLVDFVDKDGNLDQAVICTEGVGNDLEVNNTMLIFCREGFHQVLIPIYVKRIPLKPEQVDFAEFVRTFGDRLESNWSLWHHRIVKAESARAKEAKAARK